MAVLDSWEANMYGRSQNMARLEEAEKVRSSVHLNPTRPLHQTKSATNNSETRSIEINGQLIAQPAYGAKEE